MDRLFTRLLALLLVLALVPLYAMAAENIEEATQEVDSAAEEPVAKDFVEYFAPETEEEQEFWDCPAFGLYPGASYQKFRLGKATSFPIDLLLLLPKDLDPAAEADNESGLCIRVTYTDDQERVVPAQYLNVSSIEWNEQNEDIPAVYVSADFWPDYCRGKAPQLWEHVALSSLDIQEQYELYHITAEAVECPTDLTRIDLQVDLILEDCVYQMKSFPVFFEISEEDAEEPSDEDTNPIEELMEALETVETGEAEPDVSDEPETVIAEITPMPTDLIEEQDDDEQLQLAVGTEMPTPTPAPISNLNPQRTRMLKSYLICLGYLPQEYLAVFQGEEEYDEMTIEAVKQYQKDYGKPVSGNINQKLLEELEDIVIAQKELSSAQAYNQKSYNRSLCRDLIALGYLQPQALETLETDTSALTDALQRFKADHNINTTDSMSVALISALQNVMPTVSPMPTPAPTPIPLTLLSQNETNIIQRQDMFLYGTAPAWATVIVCCHSDGHKIILGEASADEQGVWNYTITAEQLDAYFEDRSSAQIYVLQTVSQVDGNHVQYNATPSDRIENIRFYRHGNELTLLGQTKPYAEITVDGKAYAKADQNGYIELDLNVLSDENCLKVYIDSDLAHPQMIEIKNEIAKARFKFLQPVSVTVEMILAAVLFVGFAVTFIIKLKKRTGGKHTAGKGPGSSKQKGGSSHA